MNAYLHATLLGYRSDDSIEHLPNEHEFVTGMFMHACLSLLVLEQIAFRAISMGINAFVGRLHAELLS